MNKNLIFYFSGTGNTQMIAERLSSKQKDTILLPISKYQEYIVNEKYSSIGIMYPTYYASVPNIVREFIKNLTIEVNPGYLYLIASCGAINGNSHRTGVKLLKQKGCNVDYATTIRSFSNYILWFDVSEKALLNPAKYDNKIDLIIDKVCNREKVVSKKEIYLFKLWNQIEGKDVKIRDDNFTINDDCIGCNICIDICPVDNISKSIEEDKPIYNNNCEQCLACIHNCSKQAINYLNKTQKRKRYLNPRIKLNELNTKKIY